MSLGSQLFKEQQAFLRRDRRDWGPHLARCRAFLGDPPPGPAPLLVLGAGAGLEVPWKLLEGPVTGWDADPMSRLRTWLRHRRWPAWVFQDLCGGFQELEATVLRCLAGPGGRGRRKGPLAAARLAGLLPSLRPEAGPLRDRVARNRPGCILSANVMGQFGVLAQRTVERHFAPGGPWEPDPERPDALAEALDAWTRRALKAFLAALGDSGAALRLVHDRGVVLGHEPFSLGPMQEPWTAMLRSDGCLELSDPLCGLDVAAELDPRLPVRHERWIWRLAPGQTHVVEALAFDPVL